MIERRYFGTDGIRGRVGTAPITPEFMMKLGWAAGQVLAPNGGEIVIGKDTRLSGYMFESAIEAGLSAAGTNILLVGPMSTPAIAYLTRTFRADAGIVISASHNPYYDNGIKFFSADGKKLPDDIELAIEAKLQETMTIVEQDQLGKARRLDDAVGRYVEFCKASIPTHMDLDDLNIVLDCANGATYHMAPMVFRELGANVHEINVDPDGLNINDQCGATYLAPLQALVVAEHADVGIAFDGDGDRVMMVDRHGNIIDGDQILFIITAHRHRQGLLNGGVVGTLMTNYGLELAYQELGIPFERANVGDRYVMEKLLELDWEFGGESSGHIICLNKTSTGAGIVSALQVLRVMRETGKDLVELASEMTKLPQVMINVAVDDKSIINSSAVQTKLQELEQSLAGTGRILLRPSGTEPLVRVMVECRDATQAKKCAEQLAKLIH